MAVLVVAEYEDFEIKPATRCAVTAALKLSSDVHIVVLGANLQKVAQSAAQIQGVSKIITVDIPALASPLAENWAPVIAEIGKNSYSHILVPATTFGKNILPRVAALLDIAQISDVIAIQSEDTFDRPIYAGNIIATVQSTDKIKALTIRTTAFDPAPETGGSASIETLNLGKDLELSKFINLQKMESARPELTSARVIVSGGRGLQSAENFKMLEELADTLKAAIGASRAAVDAGYVPNDYQVGQTGKIVAPDLYIAIGISGAIQHLAGMKDSKVIVAINKDEEAPLMQIADYALAGDLFTIVPELIKALKA